MNDKYEGAQRCGVAENIDYDFILKLLGIIGGSIGLLRYLDYHYKSKINDSAKHATSLNDIDHLQDQFNSLSKELTSHKKDIYSKISHHEDFADDRDHRYRDPDSRDHRRQ